MRTPSSSNSYEEANTVMHAVIRELELDFSNIVNIVDIWIDSPNSVCIIYKYINSINFTLGRRITFPPHAVPNNPSSTGEDWAQTISEPLGASLQTVRHDPKGIAWVGIPDNENLPCHGER